MFYYFDTSISNTFIQIGIGACVFIGPFLFFYIKSIIKPKSKISRNWKYHLLLLTPFILYIFIQYPYRDNRYLWAQYFMKFVVLEWLVYLVLSGIVLAPIIRKIFIKAEKIITIEVWLLNIFFGTLILWIGYFLAFFTSTYIVGGLVFSLLIYLLVVLLFFSKKKKSVLYPGAQKYLKRQNNNDETNVLLVQFDILLKEEKLFKKTDLTISEVATNLNVSSHYLSQVINDNLQKSFPVLISEYRVSYAKKMILENDLLTLEAIGNECGFKSKSAFYNAFKKQLKTTPASYKKQNKKLK
ncbi:MAG: helix-turn-helix transcriptional regulator [Flavobacteriaceae bacterium]